MPNESPALRIAEKEPETKKEQERAIQRQQLQQIQIYFLSSMARGVFSVGAFNWFDRALYLAMVNERPLWTKENFLSPFQGCLQAMTLKCCFGSVYYISQSEAHKHLYPFVANRLNWGEVPANLSVGLVAGAANAIITNPANAVKYQMWGDDQAKFVPTAKTMWKAGKLEPFLRGTRATVYRDAIFGAFYEIIRGRLRKTVVPREQATKSKGGILTMDFACSSTSGILATILATPYNYARNIQYKTLPQDPVPRTGSIFRSLNQESKKQSSNMLERARFFARSFKLGGGTVRSGFGMAFGQIVFDTVKETLVTHMARFNK